MRELAAPYSKPPSAGYARINALITQTFPRCEPSCRSHFRQERGGATTNSEGSR